MSDNQKLAIWLTLATNIGTELPSALIKYFGSVKAVYEADEEALSAFPKISRENMERLLDKDLSRSERIADYCEKNSVSVMTIEDNDYPKRFFSIPNPPIVLYFLGAFCNIDAECTVAVVGTRNAGSYGTNAAKRLAFDLSKSGAVIVGGLAAGIDGIAHRAALVAGGFTIGFLGCGIDRFYPDVNKDLIAEVASRGLVMTEYPPGTPPYGTNFPVRNRLIAAISLATVVIEAPPQSGALITAEYAMRIDGKELFALPGSIFSKNSAGSNHLLRIGAKPILEAEDVLSLYRKKFPTKLMKIMGDEKEEAAEAKGKKASKKKVYRGLKRAVENEETGKIEPPRFEAEDGETKPVSISQEEYNSKSELERKLLESLAEKDADIDDLIEENDNISEVMRTMTRLEIEGLVRALPGGIYRAAYKVE